MVLVIGVSSQPWNSDPDALIPFISLSPKLPFVNTRISEVETASGETQTASNQIAILSLVSVNVETAESDSRLSLAQLSAFGFPGA